MSKRVTNLRRVQTRSVIDKAAVTFYVTGISWLAANSGGTYIYINPLNHFNARLALFAVMNVIMSGEVGQPVI